MLNGKFGASSGKWVNSALHLVDFPLDESLKAIPETLTASNGKYLAKPLVPFAYSYAGGEEVNLNFQNVSSLGMGLSYETELARYIPGYSGSDVKFLTTLTSTGGRSANSINSVKVTSFNLGGYAMRATSVNFNFDKGALFIKSPYLDSEIAKDNSRFKIPNALVKLSGDGKKSLTLEATSITNALAGSKRSIEYKKISISSSGVELKDAKVSIGNLKYSFDSCSFEKGESQNNLGCVADGQLSSVSFKKSSSSLELSKGSLTITPGKITLVTKAKLLSRPGKISFPPPVEATGELTLEAPADKNTFVDVSPVTLSPATDHIVVDWQLKGFVNFNVDKVIVGYNESKGFYFGIGMDFASESFVEMVNRKLKSGVNNFLGSSGAGKEITDQPNKFFVGLAEDGTLLVPDFNLVIPMGGIKLALAGSFSDDHLKLDAQLKLPEFDAAKSAGSKLRNKALKWLGTQPTLSVDFRAGQQISIAIKNLDIGPIPLGQPALAASITGIGVDYRMSKGVSVTVWSNLSLTALNLLESVAGKGADIVGLDFQTTFKVESGKQGEVSLDIEGTGVLRLKDLIGLDSDINVGKMHLFVGFAPNPRFLLSASVGFSLPLDLVKVQNSGFELEVDWAKKSLAFTANGRVSYFRNLFSAQQTIQAGVNYRATSRPAGGFLNLPPATVNGVLMFGQAAFKIGKPDSTIYVDIDGGVWAYVGKGSGGKFVYSGALRATADITLNLSWFEIQKSIAINAAMKIGYPEMYFETNSSILGKHVKFTYNMSNGSYYAKRL